ncbi:MAG: FHA domain-containing protein [Myxococcales bacterium]
MARYSLEILMRDFARDRERFVAQHPHAVLMWAPAKSGANFIEKTCVSKIPTEPVRDEPIAVEVVKGVINGFPFGVTIGHAENNDIVLPNQHVSRFHAYIKHGPEGSTLVDADSTNGTFLDGVRLAPTKPMPLPPEAHISFGGEVVKYLEPSQLVAHLTELLAQPRMLE